MQLGFVGLGAMGEGIARNIARQLAQEGAPPLLLYNRTASKAQRLAGAPGSHCSVAASLQALAQACDLVFMIVADDAAAQQVVQQMFAHGAAAGARPGSGKVLVNLSTSQPAAVEALERALAAAGGSLVNCPVFGRPDAAAAAQLLACPAGPAAAKAHALPYLRAISRAVNDLGEHAARSASLKLVGNFMLASCIEMLGEAMALADKSGVTRQQLLQFVDAFFPAPAVQGYASRMAADSFEAGAGFTVELGLKDVGYIRALAEAHACHLPLADLVFGHLLAAKADGRGGQDWSAAATAIRRAAGLPADGAAGTGAAVGVPESEVSQ